MLQGDPSSEGLFVYRLKMPASYKIPPHLHKASENVTVLSGVFFVGSGEKFDQGAGQELPVGGFVSIPPNHPHFAWAGGQETVVQVHGVGPERSQVREPRRRSEEEVERFDASQPTRRGEMDMAKCDPDEASSRTRC